MTKFVFYNKCRRLSWHIKKIKPKYPQLYEIHCDNKEMVR